MGLSPRLCLLLASLAALWCLASADCSVSIDQTLSSSWTQDGVSLSQWNARVVASGSETVTSLVLTVGGSADIVQLWGLTPVSGRDYSLPDYVVNNGGLASGAALSWGYIWQSSAQAPVTVSSIQCGGGGESPSPSASAVANPSASSSPNAPASPSPSTVVSTPGPCQLTLSLTARSASSGGSWTVGDTFFQIYDLNVLNSGSSPVTASVISVTLNSAQDQTITQFWNLQRQSATSSLFNVVNPGGNIEVGATLGAGFIVSTPLSEGNQLPPSVSLVSVSCIVSTPMPSSLPSSAPSSQPSSAPSSQPSGTPSGGCSASVTIVARSAGVGGNWTTGPGQFFQIFDITISNTGSRPVNGGVLTFSLPQAGSSISQWWELNRQDNSLVFNIAFNFGPLQVGASQGAGIVVQTSSPSQELPGFTLSNLACA